MKKILGLVVLMMVMLVSVSGLAATDSVIIPVNLNVPAFVRLSVDSSDDGQFDLAFDPANPDTNPTDTVKLQAVANVTYDVISSVTPVSGYENWASKLSFNINSGGAIGFGLRGATFFDVTATINIMDTLELGSLPTTTKIADVTFTISSL